MSDARTKPRDRYGNLIAQRTPEDTAIIARLTYGRATSGADGHARVGRWGENYTLTQDRDYADLLNRLRSRT